ncbi:hypothetical protein Tco_0515555, partial [Tanacetum coccineum]
MAHCGRRGDCGEAEAVEVKEEDGLGFVEWISKKRTKTKSQNNKTGHGMEKHGKDKVKT